jgi:hypothetical protein
MPANCWRSNTLLLRDGNYRVRGVPVYGHYLQALAQPAVAADRFAREIVRILTASVVRSRRLMGRPLGGCHLAPYQSKCGLRLSP